MNVQWESYFKRKLLRYKFLWNFFYTDKKNVIICFHVWGVGFSYLLEYSVLILFPMFDIWITNLKFLTDFEFEI